MDKKQQFTQKLNSIFGEKYMNILEQISQPKKYFSFRTIKPNVQKTFGIKVFDGPFENTFYCGVEDKKVARLHDGEIYIQSFSSMLAVRSLAIKPKDNLLDVCAAPGGKSAYASNLANNEIAITALDNNAARINAMKENFNTLGVKDFEIKKMDASRAQSDPTMISRFDKVIVDVPCSNEGLIRFSNSPSSYVASESAFDFWNPKLSKHLPMLQKRILASAINCLKPGGTLVYSTCTYSPEENEEVVDWVLQKFPEVALQQIKTEGVLTVDGFTQWKKKTYNEKLSLTKRILPDEKYDGFYIAKLLRRL